jgi:phosphate transport system substrate-binding protein
VAANQRHRAVQRDAEESIVVISMKEMTMRLSKLFVTLSLLVVVTMVLSACGAPAAQPTTAPAEPTAAPAEPTAAPAEPTAAPAEPTAAPAEPTAAPEPVALSGSINIDGSSTVFPITEAISEKFNEMHPDVRIAVGVSGTGGGFKKFCANETDVQDASRAIKDSEAEECKAAGIEFTEFLVGLDGIVNVVNPSNDFATCLTVEQLTAIWSPDSTVNNWNQVDPSFPDLKLALYGPGTDSGTFDFFTEVINGEAKKSRSDYTASEDDNVLVQGVAGDDGGLGYFGLAYFIANEDQLTGLAVDDGNGCVTPSFETVADGSYTPLARPLFIYAKNSALERPEVFEYIRFYLENASVTVAEVGYVPVDDSIYADALAKLESMQP